MLEFFTNRRRKECRKSEKEFDKEYKEFMRLMKYAEDLADMSKPVRQYKLLEK